MWTLYRDEIGVAVPETRTRLQPLRRPRLRSGRLQRRDAERRLDQRRLDVHRPALRVPSTIRPGRRSRRYLDGGPAPTFTYHRFWAQVDIALANAEYGRLFQ